MTLWQDITTAALLGTERQPFTPPAAPGELSALLARLPADSEGALLGAAAACSQGRRAGALPPVSDAPLPAPCPPETLPVCGPRVAQGVAQGVALVLNGKHRVALLEMLAALAGAGRIAPAPLLPALLKQGSQSKALRDAVLPVLGNRGRWLAAQNREWAWADQLILETAESPEQVWTEGGREARLAALVQLRQADPARGLALLQSTWVGENAADREVFLAALETGLCEADEPLLEAALGDRGKDVRRAALRLLGRLPESAFAWRMIARAQPLLVGKSSPIGGFSLEVTLPAAHDKDMERDGISKDPPSVANGFPKMGDKAWWLCQIVGAVPLDHWTQTWRCSPAEIIEAADKTEWAALLRRAWERAVSRQPDADWLPPLLHGGPAEANVHRSHQALQDAIMELPADVTERFILEQLRPQPHLSGEDAPVPLHDDHPALSLLLGHRRPWSAGLSRIVIESIRQRIPGGSQVGQTAWLCVRSLPAFAALVPPALAEEMTTGWPPLSEDQRYWEGPIHEFITTLQFRHDLLQDISKETRP